MIAPAYIAEKLSPVAADRRRIVAVSYSPLTAVIDAVSRLSKPSMIGLVSVSGAGLKTVSGMIAPLLQSRHTSHLFLLKRGAGNHPFTLRRFSADDYKPTNILRTTDATTATVTAAVEREIVDASESIPISDMFGIDMLILDSVASRLLSHRRSVRYGLLSEESLGMIEEAARTIRKREGSA